MHVTLQLVFNFLSAYSDFKNLAKKLINKILKIILCVRFFYQIALNVIFHLILNESSSNYDTGKRGCIKVITLVPIVSAFPSCVSRQYPL